MHPGLGNQKSRYRVLEELKPHTAIRAVELYFEYRGRGTGATRRHNETKIAPHRGERSRANGYLIDR